MKRAHAQAGDDWLQVAGVVRRRSGRLHGESVPQGRPEAVLADIMLRLSLWDPAATCSSAGLLWTFGPARLSLNPEAAPALTHCTRASFPSASFYCHPYLFNPAAALVRTVPSCRRLLHTPSHTLSPHSRNQLLPHQQRVRFKPCHMTQISRMTRTTP